MGTLHPKYLTDDSGNKIAVVLPLGEYEELLEDVRDLAAIAERRDDPVLTHKEVIAQLKENSHLQD